MFIREDYPKRIDSQIDEYTTPLPISDIKDNDNNVILTANLLISYLYNTYGNYKTNAPLANLWFLYDSTHHADFLKAWSAWTAHYDPLENYNGIETNVRQYMDGETTQTVSHGKKTTNTILGGGMKTETKVTTFDSTTPRDDNITTSTGSTETADSGTTTTTTDQTVKSLTVDGKNYTADKIEAETNARHGNLGVTTSQQMITSECDMRLNPLITMYLDAFISDYAYYVSEMWGCYE